MARQKDRGSRGSDESKSKSSRSWYSLALLVLVCGGGLPVVLQIFDKASSLMSRGYESLDLANTDQIRSVFFSGEPWVVMCSSDEETPEEAAVLSALDRVGKLSGTNLKQTVPPSWQRFRIGVVRCDLPLPSKQTIFERFKLKRQGRLPTVFIVANGDRPSPLSAGVLQDVISASSGSSSSSPTPASTLVAQATQRLFEHIRSRVEPNLAFFSTTQHVKKFCIEKPRCVIAVAQSELTQTQKAAVATLIDQYRNIKFGTINLNYSDFSLTDRLGFTREATGPKDSEVRLVYFRKPSSDSTGSEGEATSTPAGTTRARAFKDSFSLSAAQAFIESSLALPNDAGKDSGLVTLKKCPTITSRKHARSSSKGKEETENKSRSSSSKPSRPKEPEQPAKPAQREKKREEVRREAPKPAAKKEDIYAGARKNTGPKKEDGMRAEAMDESAEEEEEEEGESEPAEEEGEEVIDLDDSEL